MTKTIGSLIRTLSAAAVLAAALNLAGGTAWAAPKSPAQLSCEARGYMWDSQKGCADKSCTIPPGQPGDTRFEGTPGTTFVIKMCDGFTGKWTKVALTAAGVGPLASLPVLQHVPPPDAQIPVAPLPGGGVLSPH